MLKDLVKEILKEELGEKKESISELSMIERLVMVRTYSAGVHFGTLKYKNGKEIILYNAHRVFYWSNACSLSQLAMEASGGQNENNKISMAVNEILLTEAIEIIPITNEVFKSLIGTIWKK